MKTIQKILSVFVLVTFLMSSFMIATVSADEIAASDVEPENQNSTVDFVIVLDSSESLESTSPAELCKNACKMFIDMVPLENARVSVIAFGNKNPEGVHYEMQTYETIKDENGKDRYITHEFQGKFDQNAYTFRDLPYIKVISDLQETNNVANRTAMKETVEKEVNKSGQHSMPGLAALSAVDLLRAHGASYGNACIILVSDAQEGSEAGYEVDEEFLDTHAPAEAKKNGWPIYTIQLNLNNTSKQVHYDRMEKAAVGSGAGPEGHIVVTNLEDGSDNIAKAFLDIFERFMFGGEGTGEIVNADGEGYVEKIIDIPDLVSEATIVAYGEGVDSIELYYPADSSRPKYVIQGTREEDRVIGSVEPGYYASAKLICPEAGKWKVRAHGDPKAKIALYDCPIRDLDLTLSVKQGTQVLSANDLANTTFVKNDALTFEAYFNYHGQNLQTSQYYQKNQPKLIITSQGEDQTREVPICSMEGTETGYSITIELIDLLHSGDITIQAKLEDSDLFRDGVKYSEPVRLSILDAPLEVIDDHPNALSGYVNEVLHLDMSDYFYNPDGDKLDFKITCQNETFDYQVDPQNDSFVDLNLGMKVSPEGKPFVLTFGAIGEEASCNVELTVQNREVEQIKKIPSTIILHKDSPLIDLARKIFADIGESEKTIALDEYFSDPDGVSLTVKDIDYDKEIVNVAISDDQSSFDILPEKKGDCTLTFTVFDGVDSDDSFSPPVQQELDIRVVSVFSLLLRKYWWVLLIGVAVGILLLYRWARSWHKSDQWIISVRVGNNDPAKTQTVYLKTYKKHRRKWPFVKWLKNILDDEQIEEDVIAAIENEKTLRKMFIVGGIRYRFVLTHIPKTLKVSCESELGRKTVHVSKQASKVEIITADADEEISILMTREADEDEYEDEDEDV